MCTDSSHLSFSPYFFVSSKQSKYVQDNTVHNPYSCSNRQGDEGSFLLLRHSQVTADILCAIYYGCSIAVCKSYPDYSQLMSLRVIYPPVRISKGALGNLPCKSFSFDHWYYTRTDDWCHIPICAPAPLAYPLLPPLALVLTDTDVKRACAREPVKLRAKRCFQKGADVQRKKRAIAPQGLSARRAKDARHMGPFGNLGQSLCSPAYTAGPRLQFWKDFLFFYFFLGWSAGCFTFRSLNKQEIKRTSNKMANRAPHITLLSWEAQCESFWGVGVPGVAHP